MEKRKWKWSEAGGLAQRLRALIALHCEAAELDCSHGWKGNVYSNYQRSLSGSEGRAKNALPVIERGQLPGGRCASQDRLGVLVMEGEDVGDVSQVCAKREPDAPLLHWEGRKEAALPGRQKSTPVSGER